MSGDGEPRCIYSSLTRYTITAQTKTALKSRLRSAWANGLSAFLPNSTPARHSAFFERSYAEILGLSVESGMPLRFSTAMGSFDAYGHAVTLETLGYSFDVTVYFAAHETLHAQRVGPTRLARSSEAWPG
jgi:hypothetical protein